MTTFVRCDGYCGQELSDRYGTGKARTAITGRRIDMSGGYGLPDDEFHLCAGCARTAFLALRKERARREQQHALPEVPAAHLG